MHRRSEGVGRIGAIVLAIVSSGCAVNAVPSTSPSAGPYCVDDSSVCIGQRQAALKSIMADKSRTWVRQPATPHAYASGVRLFAYRGKKAELTCDELAWGRKEAELAPASLRGAAGITPAQASRGTMLATEVSKELAREYARRCRKG